MRFRSNCLRGGSPTPAPASENSCSPPPPAPSKKNSATPARCIAGPAFVPQSRCTCCGICRTGPPVLATCSQLRRGTDCAPDPSTRTCFKTRSTSTGRSAIPTPRFAKRRLQHILDSVEIGKRLGSRDLSLWFADGSNYPGTQNIRHRRKWFEEGLAAAHARLSSNQRMLVEYKPFEPAFYHTDIADWGMALLLAQAAGPQAKVLVDTGHHYQAQNIEQIVAWLLDLDMLGGFHFNDRRYADDDLTMGSIDPYQVFRIFHEILHFEWETGERADIAYMIDQSHNLKGKIEAMIQTVTTAMELYAKAALVDHDEAGGASDALRAGGCGDLPEGRILDRRAAGDSRVGAVEGAAGRPDGCVPAERLPGTDHGGARGAEYGFG